MKVATYIADWLAGLNAHVYGVCGAGAMHLNDAICHHPGLKVIATHHEQGAAFAAEADARVSGKPGIVMVTAGPGGTNAATGIACAYVDSIPLVVIAGQVTTDTLRSRGLRQRGMNELPVAEMMRPITKFAVTILDPAMVRPTLDKAAWELTHGRPGPVFIEVPLDIQAAELPTATGHLGWPKPSEPTLDLAGLASRFVRMMREASRPVVVVGNGARAAQEPLRALLTELQIPAVTSWAAIDIVPADHSCLIGRMGIFGDRAGNFAVQNADLVIALGSRLSVPQTGHAADAFAKDAMLVMVDVDAAEFAKRGVEADLGICVDLGEAIVALRKAGVHHYGARWPEWKSRCLQWKLRYGVAVRSGMVSIDGGGVNAYHLARQIAQRAPDNAIIVTDVGFSYLPLMQSIKLKRGQRLMHSGGVSPMGWAIPAAIGAACAGNGRPVICVTGDGGAMMNLQELQTIAHHRWPITILVLANDGYATMRLAQQAHFDREAMSGFATGLSCPQFPKVAEAFGIPTWSVHDDEGLDAWMGYLASREHPILAEVHMARGQVIAPRVMSRIEDGKFVPAALEDMWPYLDRGELAANMGNDALALEAVGAGV